MSDEVVRFETEDGTVVLFEVDPPEGYGNAGADDELIGRIEEAIEPAVKAARVVLAKLRDARPDEVEVKFGVKVSGQANWLVAKASTDANFEVTLTWKNEDVAATS